MKKFVVVLLAAALVIGGCDFLMGPDEPAGGGGNLVISLGEAAAARAIGSGAELPPDVLASLRYELTLTGPNGETLSRTVSGGEALKLTAALGDWRIDASAYQQEVPAGTGSLAFTVASGINSVRVPMNMHGTCYEIDQNGLSGGKTNFTAAFAGTTITFVADRGFVFKPGSGKYNTGLCGSEFTMPDSDVTVSAKFISTSPVRYVRQGGTGTDDGLSWDTASGDLQVMMDELAVLYSERYEGPFVVKVGAGTYKPAWKPMIPASPDDLYTYDAGARDSAFILRQGVQVWGGYPGAGGAEVSRDIAANVTTLSGDIDNSNSLSAGDAYHVVLGVDIPAGSGTVLDGFTIRGGNAVDPNPIQLGDYELDRDVAGGIGIVNSSPVLTNLTISGNNAASAGGIAIAYGNCAPVLANVRITGNNALSRNGGGLCVVEASPVLINAVVSGNSSDNAGGGIDNEDGSSPVLINVFVSGNSAKKGGGINNQGDENGQNGSSPKLINVTISGNSASGNNNCRGGGIFNTESSSPHIKNSIIWGNTASSDPGICNDGTDSIPVISFSIVQGSRGNGGAWVSATGTDGGNNLDDDPRFVASGDYRLNTGSQAINAGSDGLYPADAGAVEALAGVTLSAEAKAAINAALGKDLDGNPRRQGTIDMGAYEH